MEPHSIAHARPPCCTKFFAMWIDLKMSPQVLSVSRGLDHRSIKMSSFFLSENKKSGNRKRANKPSKTSGPKAKKTSKAKQATKQVCDDAELESDIDSASDHDSGNDEKYESDESETAQEKKIRLSKQYLAQLEEEERQKNESQDIDHDAVSHRLQQDLIEQSGKFQKQIADKFSPPLPSLVRVLRGHQLPITCLCVSPDDKFVFTGSKDCSVIKWDVENGKKVGKIAGTKDSKTSKGCILAISITSDGKFLATGGKEKVIHIYDPETLKHIHSFNGHRNTLTGLAFRKGTHQLFSGSLDKTVKIWNLDEMAYVETLYGHQDGVTGIDSLSRDRAVTTGGRDRSLRIWKVVEETQLVINVDGGSVDCVQLINEDHMITGADDGSISLWSSSKKKPLCNVNNAHGKSKDDQNDNIPDETWITAVAAVKSTDLVASGSCDSCIRLWKCGPGYRSLTPLFTIPMVGFVNSLAFSSDGEMLFAGVGQEHRLGRWWRTKDAKNALYIIPLQKSMDH